MDSFSTGKLKEICTYLQLIVGAMGCIDDDNKINPISIYDIISGISDKDDDRQADINGTLQEQIKALNDNISNLASAIGDIKAGIDRTNNHLDYIDDMIGHSPDGTGYARIMPPGDGWYWKYE